MSLKITLLTVPLILHAYKPDYLQCVNIPLASPTLSYTLYMYVEICVIRFHLKLQFNMHINHNSARLFAMCKHTFSKPNIVLYSVHVCRNMCYSLSFKIAITGKIKTFSKLSKLDFPTRLTLKMKEKHLGWKMQSGYPYCN